MLLILTSHLDYFQIHKISETVIVYKKDEKLECRLIYRPISLLPNLRKIFLKPEVKPFLENTKQLDQFQFDFSRKYFILHAVISLID